MAGGNRDRAPRLVIVVDAAERLEVLRVEALDAERQAVDSRFAKGCEAGGLNGSRIGFERDLGARQERQAAAQGGQELIEPFAREQARRPATKKDAVDAASPDQRQRRFEIGKQGGKVVAFRDCRRAASGRRQRMRVEIAVGALLHAPRNMDVKRERRRTAKSWFGFLRCCQARLRQQRNDPSTPAARHQRGGESRARSCRRSTRRASAWPRCERRFFSAASSSAAVRSSSRR
ncbi:MAG: hypothetical protein AW09_003409 [Candidatus Accumulibacter phosphatis]|uniref:Uncharacterized protein n=1 Tax=Candidatus Accumulibacter phosphatis TaxID=327160 RepID=A0A080LSP3_9PROT|nr:MAG: hypothetical protein AW09_003409 [Candidatus Accumulibacter phosphatis]